MKKINIAALILGATMSGSAFASAFTGTSDITTTDCTMLAKPVTLAISANVHGMWMCDDVNAVIKVGACHKGGSREPAKCARIDTNSDGKVDSTDGYNYTGCDATTEGTVIDGAVASLKAFVIGSGGGTVAGIPLNTSCSEGSIGAMPYFAQ